MPPNGWLLVRMRGPSLGMLSNSVSKQSTEMRRWSSIALENSGPSHEDTLEYILFTLLKPNIFMVMVPMMVPSFPLLPIACLISGVLMIFFSIVGLIFVHTNI